MVFGVVWLVILAPSSNFAHLWNRRILPAFFLFHCFLFGECSGSELTCTSLSSIWYAAPASVINSFAQFWHLGDFLSFVWASLSNNNAHWLVWSAPDNTKSLLAWFGWSGKFRWAVVVCWRPFSCFYRVSEACDRRPNRCPCRSRSRISFVSIDSLSHFLRWEWPATPVLCSAGDCGSRRPSASTRVRDPRRPPWSLSCSGRNICRIWRRRS